MGNQLNASALFILQASLPPEELPHIRPFNLAKDAWDHINSIYKGSSSIQCSNFEVILDGADEFVMNEDEDPRELYRRLTTLVVALHDHGSKDTDGNWVKRKFLQAVMPFNKSMSSVIRQRPDFHTLSSNDVLDEFVAMNILNKTADNVLARVCGTKKPNIALKAKAVQEEEEEEEEESCPEDTKYAYHEHMALASRQFWGNKRNFKSNYSRNNSSGSKPRGQRVRTCHNCGNVSHFIVDCPYEKREDNGGKLICKDKTKSFPSKNNNYVKKMPQKGVGGIKKSTTLMMMMNQAVKELQRPPLPLPPLPLHQMLLFDSPNENITNLHKCLMAKASKATPPTKSIILTNPSLMDCVGDSERG